VASPNEPPVVALGPDVLARAFFDPHCLRVLQLWRDGRLRLAVSRPLLVRYVRLLGALGLEPNLVRRWLWWLTAADRVVVIEEEEGWRGVPVISSCADKALPPELLRVAPDQIERLFA